MLIELFSSHQFWAGLLAIIMTNLVLSGDNAVVIALAASSLPKQQQGKAIMWGSMAAAVLLILLTIVAVTILQWPFLKLIGGLMLLWVGIQLVSGEDEDEEPGVEGHTHLMHAIRTILIANLVMSLDNTLAVASLAEQIAGGLSEPIRLTSKYILLSIGLGVSIPVVVFGSKLVMWIIKRFPIIIILGGALIGWIAGEMLVTDKSTAGWVDVNAPWLETMHIASIIGAVIVVVVGKWMAARAARSAGHAEAEGRADPARVS